MYNVSRDRFEHTTASCTRVRKPSTAHHVRNAKYVVTRANHVDTVSDEEEMSVSTLYSE